MDNYTARVYNTIMIRDKQELMKTGWFWAFYCLNSKKGKDPFVLFEDSYGYPATEALVGKTDLNMPDNVRVLGSTTPGHIALR